MGEEHSSVIHSALADSTLVSAARTAVRGLPVSGGKIRAACRRSRLVSLITGSALVGTLVSVTRQGRADSADNKSAMPEDSDESAMSETDDQSVRTDSAREPADMSPETGNQRSEATDSSGRSAQPPTATQSESSPESAGSRMARSSILARAGRRGRKFIVQSWLYRWLTAEPEPDVIVIDLRETWTVGPFLVLFDRLLRGVESVLPTSLIGRVGRRLGRVARNRPVQLTSGLVGSLALLLAIRVVLTGATSPVLVGFVAVLAALAISGSRVTWTWAELRETRGFQVLAAAFEPPEPPESTGTDEAFSDRRDRDGAVEDTAPDEDESPDLRDSDD